MARKMKDSGIEWIGEIPEGWETCRIKNVVTCHDEWREPISADKRENSLKLYDYYGASGVIDTIDNYNVDSTVLLIGEDGANLRLRNLPLVYRASGKFWVNNHTHILVVPPRNDYSFIAHLLESGDFTNYITGSAQPKLSQFNLMQFPIAIPSLDEQKHISNYLDIECSRIDAMLTKTRSSIEEYKKLKQAVITQAVTKGVRGERETKESKLPWASKIPKAWNICAIRHIMFECKERTKDGHEEQLSVTQQFGIIKSSDASIANPSLSLDDWRIVAIGDIVFNKYKAHSGVFFVSPFSGIVTFNYSVYRCFPNCYAKYFEYQYKTHGCISEFRTRMHGVGNSISPLYTKDLMKIKVVYPPLDEQKEIANYLDAKCAEIDKLIAKKEQLVKELESYKKSLIYEVVTGKREV